MSSYPYIALLPDRTVVGLAFRPCHAARLSRSSPPNTVRIVATSQITSLLSESLRCLEIVLGPEVNSLDDEALMLTLRYARANCLDLESLFIFADSRAWTAARIHCTLQTVNLSPQHFECRIRDNRIDAEVHLLKRQGHTTSRARLPLDLIEDETIRLGLLQLSNLQELVLSQPRAPSLFPENSFAIQAALICLIGLNCLRKVTVPLDILAGIITLLHIISALPHLQKLVLLPPGSFLLSPTTKAIIVTSLTTGLQGFQHLRKLSLPLDIICDSLLDSLAEIAELRTLTLTPATSSIQAISRHAVAGQFPNLHHLRVSGSLSIFANVVRACVHQSTNLLTSVRVVTQSLQHAREMYDALEVVAARRRGLRTLNIHIRDIHAAENRTWLDLAPLFLGYPTLEEFSIKHPRPLPLLDTQIRDLLQNWPLLQRLSLNPRPLLNPWRIERGSQYYLPTLGCLGHVAEHAGQSLLHFGVYLNSQCGRGEIAQGVSLPTLKELDLGDSHNNWRSTKLIRLLFPKAVLV